MGCHIRLYWFFVWGEGGRHGRYVLVESFWWWKGGYGDSATSQNFIQRAQLQKLLPMSTDVLILGRSFSQPRRIPELGWNKSSVWGKN